jgi:hypothetical protein
MFTHERRDATMGVASGERRQVTQSIPAAVIAANTFG